MRASGPSSHSRSGADAAPDAPHFSEDRGAWAVPLPDRLLGGWPMLEPISPLLFLIVGALAGVLVGVAHAYAERRCPCCKLLAVRTASRCPHCRCRMD